MGIQRKNENEGNNCSRQEEWNEIKFNVGFCLLMSITHHSVLQFRLKCFLHLHALAHKTHTHKISAVQRTSCNNEFSTPKVKWPSKLLKEA